MHLYQREKDLIDKFKNHIKTSKCLNKPGATKMTTAILDFFRIEGNLQGFHISPDKGSQTPEWLFDMVWFQHKKGQHTWVKTEIELILESELSYNMNEIRTDFEKLLVASPNIPFKIFICLLGNDKDGTRLNNLKGYFDDAVQSCRTVVSGDSIICLIGDDCYSGEFIIHKVVKR